MNRRLGQLSRRPQYAEPAAEATLSDCCAATKLENHLAALDMIKMQGGVFGAVATSEAFVAGLG